MSNKMYCWNCKKVVDTIEENDYILCGNPSADPLTSGCGAVLKPEKFYCAECEKYVKAFYGFIHATDQLICAKCGSPQLYDSKKEYDESMQGGKKGLK